MNEVVAELKFFYVDSDQELEDCCKRWQQSSALAMDTEFMRVSTFYPNAALFQVSDGKDITLIDPLKITQWQSFCELLTNSSIVKVLHSCSEDLLVFLNFLKVIPSPLFDTQVASSMLEHGLSVSYQNLVLHHFEVEVPKGETRSDWLQRPLTASQQEYAALDVAYLLQIWKLQEAQLLLLNRQDWMKEECERLAGQYTEEINNDFSNHYLSFKSAWQLAPAQLAALKALAQWREIRARERNKPRSWIIKDSGLFSIAHSMPKSSAQLAQLNDVSENFVRHEGDKVLALLESIRNLSIADCPPPLPKPFTQSQKGRLRKAKEIIEQKAQTLGVAPEFLGRKKTLHALFYALNAQKTDTGPVELPKELLGWRKEILLGELIGALQG